MWKQRGVTVIHLLKRRAGLAPEEFQQRWLEIDPAELTQLAGLRRYSQNHALLGGYSRGELAFDGFEEFEFDEPAQYAAAKAGPAWAALRRRHAAIAGDASLLLLVRVNVPKDGVRPLGGVKSAEFGKRRPDMSADAFRSYWAESHGPLAARISQISRYEQHHVVSSEAGTGVAPYDGWAVTWFRSTDEMRAAAASDEYRATRADEPNFLSGEQAALLVRERLVITP